MSEWATYRLSDLLLFSPRVFYRLFELVNAAAWPGHVITLVIGFALMFALMAPGIRRFQVGSVLLAGIWAWQAWFFLANHYVTINWAAAWFIPIFAAEAVLLLLAGAFNLCPPRAPPSSVSERVIQALFALALFAYPLFAPLTGRPIQQAEVFGIAPDPTAIATLLWLAAANDRFRWLPMVVPVLWCTLSGLTLWLLADPLFWLPPAIATTALICAGADRTRVD